MLEAKPKHLHQFGIAAQIRPLIAKYHALCCAECLLGIVAKDLGQLPEDVGFELGAASKLRSNNQLTVVTCPWHGASFDITTGSVLGPPAPNGVAHYNVQVDGNDIKVELP